MGDKCKFPLYPYVYHFEVSAASLYILNNNKKNSNNFFGGGFVV